MSTYKNYKSNIIPRISLTNHVHIHNVPNRAHGPLTEYEPPISAITPYRTFPNIENLKKICVINTEEFYINLLDT